MKKLRLLRFQIVPDILVEENGELATLPEGQAIQPLVVNAAGWRVWFTQFAAGGFETMLADLEKRLNQGPIPPIPVQPNRAERRRKPKSKALG